MSAPMREVARLNVWSNGKIIRKYCAQDKRHAKNPYDIKRTSPEKGFHRMVAVLYEDETLTTAPLPPR